MLYLVPNVNKDSLNKKNCVFSVYDCLISPVGTVCIIYKVL